MDWLPSPIENFQGYATNFLNIMRLNFPNLLCLASLALSIFVQSYAIYVKGVSLDSFRGAVLIVTVGFAVFWIFVTRRNDVSKSVQP